MFRTKSVGVVLVACWLFPTAPVIGQCVGDCDGDGSVSVSELVKGVQMALAGAGPAASGCAGMDMDSDGRIAVAELVSAVRTALSGCSPIPTPSPTPANGTFAAYVLNQGTISIVDPNTGVTIGTIPGVVGCGIAIAGTKAYVTECGGSSVSVIDTQSNTIVGSVNVPCCSHSAIAATVDDSAVFVLGDDLRRFFLTKIATATDEVVNNVSIDGAPKDIAAAADSVYALDQATVSVINSETGATIGTIPEVVGCGITIAGTKAYVSECGGSSVSVIDTQSDTIVGSVNVACCSHNAIAATADDSAVFVLGDDLRRFFLTKIATATDEVVDNVAVDGAPKDVDFVGGTNDKTSRSMPIN